MSKWNPEQLRAIETINKNIIVSASAGSGKTSVLVARLIRLIEKENVSLDQILAMTFTEAAASEMKKRLNGRLSELANEASDPELKAKYEYQLSLIPTAQISTIHSYCLSIIKNYYYIIGLDSKKVNNNLDTSTLSLIEKQASQATIDYLLTQDYALEFIEYFETKVNVYDNIKNNIKIISEIALNKYGPLTYLDSLKQIKYQNIDEFDSNIISYYMETIQIKYVYFNRIITEFTDYLFTTYTDKDNFIELANKLVNLNNICVEAINNNDYSGYINAYRTLARVKFPRKPRGDDTFGEFATNIKEAIDDEITNILTPEQLVNSNNLCVDVLNQLIDLSKYYIQQFKQAKDELNGIDFSDMEQYALAILQANDCFIAKEYQKQYYEIMVDEFQDSNDVQDLLVNLIKKPNNVFRVGDIKQSIYGFRHAKPEIMRNLINTANPDLDEIIYLSFNYRSKDTINQFNNFLFDKLMNFPGLKTGYNQFDSVSSGIPSQYVDNKPIMFYSIPSDLEVANTYNKDDLTADFIANQILEKYRTGEYQWKDFVVLVRSNSKKDILRKFFNRYNIPAFIDVKSGFYHSVAVSMVMSCLRFILNNNDKIIIASLVNSPLTNTNFNQFTSEKLANPDASDYSLIKDEPLIKQLLKFKHNLNNLSITSILEYIYEYNDFYHSNTSHQEKTNLDLFFDKAYDFEQNQGADLFSFIKLIDEIQDEQNAEAIPIGFDADVVRVISIHQSKGLQFPCVFLWPHTSKNGLGGRNVLIDDNLGLAIHSVDSNNLLYDNIRRSAIINKQAIENVEEELRILYVATTRAQNEMIVVKTFRPTKSAEAYNVDELDYPLISHVDYADWIYSAFLNETDGKLIFTQSITTPWVNQPVDKQVLTNNFKINEHPLSLVESDKILNVEQDLNFSTNYATNYGTLMHKFCELLPKPSWTSQQIYDLANTYDINITNKQITDLITLSEHPFYLSLFENSELMKEVNFIYKLDNQPKTGIIDLLVIKDIIYLIDYKTDNITNIEQLAVHQEQMQGYYEHIKTQYPNKQIECHLYSFKLGEFYNLPLQ